MSAVWTDVTRMRSREEKKNEENRRSTRELSLANRREYSSLRYHTGLLMTVCDGHEQGACLTHFGANAFKVGGGVYARTGHRFSDGDMNFFAIPQHA
ncbi:Uncharacterised protein [Salmonella enterica subsp. arizonae]|uniref:Uncharacterized protein n=1 Tax=Salmonella enterica subsp. arizonae TaxID=59203 RepID=A0A379SIF1_SALER|nr:hypothetical protein [Salmonella enterica]EAR7991775.1 hypothetical protein [Salmonella enterica]SUG28786.1 Uncharacterised protein [Salmonella enterica subsp. arizonae]SUG38879.1 Uncharacterised protein [Salmonella enterica subsp. arizonae]SUG43254.1 Uncharacterised protein [Salmonella enterica subsp. arizonae]